VVTFFQITSAEPSPTPIRSQTGPADGSPDVIWLWVGVGDGQAGVVRLRMGVAGGSATPIQGRIRTAEGWRGAGRRRSGFGDGSHLDMPRSAGLRPGVGLRVSQERAGSETSAPPCLPNRGQHRDAPLAMGRGSLALPRTGWLRNVAAEADTKEIQLRYARVSITSYPLPDQVAHLFCRDGVQPRVPSRTG